MTTAMTLDELRREIFDLDDMRDRELWVESIDAAIREREELRAKVPQWRPIESAPKNGTCILLWCVHDNAKYANEKDLDSWQGPVVGQWIEHNGGGWCWHGHCGKHTHWAPLLPPPERGEKDGQ